jgi:hypothetical protein
VREPTTQLTHFDYQRYTTGCKTLRLAIVMLIDLWHYKCMEQESYTSSSPNSVLLLLYVAAISHRVINCKLLTDGSDSCRLSNGRILWAHGLSSPRPVAERIYLLMKCAHILCSVWGVKWPIRVRLTFKAGCRMLTQRSASVRSFCTALAYVWKVSIHRPAV